MKREVRFTTSCHPYQGGEVAGFDPEVADALVARGVAVYHSPSVVAPVNRMMTAEPQPVVESQPAKKSEPATDAKSAARRR